jgi:carboxymethylenebutenolidase
MKASGQVCLLQHRPKNNRPLLHPMHPQSPLGHYIDLTASDHHVVRSYVVQPTAPARAAVLVLQHMDQRLPGWQGGASRAPAPESRPGVNPHVRQMAEAFAAKGYLAIAPSTFSRGHSGSDYGYRFQHKRWGQRLIRPLEPLDTTLTLRDIESALAHARRLLPAARIGVVGVCWGGLLAWRAACKLGAVSAAVCFYGGGMEAPEDRQRQPHCPTQVHFPQDPRWMSLEGQQAFREMQATARRAASHGPAPEVIEHPARYGFLQPQHEGYDAAVALTAQTQALQFLARHLDGAPAQT